MSSHNGLKQHSFRFGQLDGYDRTEQSVIQDQLKKHKLYNPRYGYSAVSNLWLPSVKKIGTYRPEDNDIYCNTIQETPEGPRIRDSADYDIAHYLKLVTPCNPGVIVVYDLAYFLDNHPRYIFRFPKQKRDAVKAILTIEDFFV